MLRGSGAIGTRCVLAVLCAGAVRLPSYVGFVLDADGGVGELREVYGQQKFRRVESAGLP